MKIKTILVSQPAPSGETSPYFILSEKENVKIDFVPFIHVEGVEASDVRKQKVNFEDFTAVILTSRNAVDNFFRLAEEMRFIVPSSMRYFCQSEAIAYYLQKYVVYRKRKIYIGGKLFKDLASLLEKHKEEKFLLPSSDILNPMVPKLLDTCKIDWTRAIMYKTVCSDLSHLEDIFYDILVFFSPSGLKSLKENFPDFKQNNTKIAAFGKQTVKAVEDMGLKCNIVVPSPETPSMTMALQKFIKQSNQV